MGNICGEAPEKALINDNKAPVVKKEEKEVYLQVLKDDDELLGTEIPLV